MNIALHQNDNWILWNPDNIESCAAYSAQITQDENEMRVAVDCTDQIIDVIFEGFVPIYVYSDEGIRMATYMPVQEKNNDKFYFRKWFLYEVKNSDFMSWALKESCGFYLEKDLMHFCIVTANDVIDILTTAAPKIVIRESNN